MTHAITISCNITSKIMKNLLNNFSNLNFRSELDIHNYLKEQAKKYNCKLAFKPCIATGKNSSKVHHRATKTKLKQGFLLIDFGVKYNGYCSDITRMLYLGKPTKKELKLYNLLLKTQKSSIKKISHKLKYKELDLYSRKLLKKYKKHYLHTLGHGLGKKIHQAPKISPKNQRFIKNNTFFTIEPGIYFKNKFGIRVEDTVYFNKRPIILTKVPKSLRIVKEY